MSRPKLVAGNWKMNTSLSEALVLAKTVTEKNQESSVQRILFVPYLFLHSVGAITQSVPNFFSGAQNCSEHASGAYTGEVSASMLRSVGCSYVLVGHSERRQYFNETPDQLIKKIKQALANNIRVIYCIGEKLNERKSNFQNHVVKAQLEEVLSSFTADEMKFIMIAYEPVWAIGTGETATPQQAQEMHAYIRTVLKEIFNDTVAQNTPILYGGSCNAQNAGELFACADIDGGLVGGASLKADDFCKIVASFK